MSSISLKNVTKIYSGGVQAVTDFNLDVDDKEFIVFVGPSGCGKSTTLRMIAGLEEISGGDLYIGDKRMNDVHPKDRDIAMVFQNYALYPHMTVFENMGFGLKLRKVPKDEIKRRVEEAARILDISHLLERKPAALSGGQRQRVALGRAIVREPRAFLLDEPLSNLDAKLRTQMRIEISKLHRKLGTTFIYVTHDQTEAMTMGDRIVVMKDGVIQQIANPQVLYDAPVNKFVAGFIGAPQMNFFEGTIVKEGSDFFIEIKSEGSEEVASVTTKIKLPASKNEGGCLEAYDGKEVTLGIRPECIYDDERYIADHQDGIIQASVEVVEPMGAEKYLYLDFLGHDLVSRVNPDSKSEVGEVATVALDVSKIHIFDKGTEKTVTN